MKFWRNRAKTAGFLDLPLGLLSKQLWLRTIHKLGGKINKFRKPFENLFKRLESPWNKLLERKLKIRAPMKSQGSFKDLEKIKSKRDYIG